IVLKRLRLLLEELIPEYDFRPDFESYLRRDESEAIGHRPGSDGFGIKSIGRITTARAMRLSGSRQLLVVHFLQAPFHLVTGRVSQFRRDVGVEQNPFTDQPGADWAACRAGIL